LTSRSNLLPRAVLEGLAGGAAAGALALAAERSSTFNVFADVLSASFRVLGGTLSEETIVRLDVRPVAFALYVGGGALAGAAVGALAGAIARVGWRPGPVARALLIGGVLAALEGTALGALWRHRGLPVSVGLALVTVAGAAAAVAAWTAGAAARTLLPGRTARVLAGFLPAAVALACAGTMIVARRGPPRPDGTVVSSPVRQDPGVKVAILGIDGLDWMLVDEAVAEGRMPNLARLIGEGTRGTLRSIRPPRSPVVWTSVATGELPSEHGIVDFVVRRDGERIPVTGNLRRVPALWDLSTVCRFTTAFTNWYVTWPAEPVAGAMISDRVDFDGLDRRVFPEELTAAVDSARAGVDALPEREIAAFTALDADFAEWRADRWGQVRRALSILDGVVRHDLVTLETARVTLRAGQPDLTAVYFRGNDNTQHLFWKYRFAEQRSGLLAGLLWNDLDPGDVEALSPVIDRYYDFVDELIGRVTAMLAPDTALLLLSDHGFLTSNERGRWYNANRVLEAAGFAVPAPDAGGAAVPDRSRVYDPDPPSVSPRRILRAGGLADDAAAALTEAGRVLDAARTADGAPLFLPVEQATDEDGPFLVAEFAADLGGDHAVVGRATVPLAEFLTPEGHSGNHRMDGFLLATGPPFRAGARGKRVRAVDVAPTVLYLLGAPVAADLEGVIALDLLDPAWAEQHPVRYVKSWGRRQSDDEAMPTLADDHIREELRALGYIQ
jgi:predicted AlkP superfamily phosphohydrolase/phosphomutase